MKAKLKVTATFTYEIDTDNYTTNDLTIIARDDAEIFEDSIDALFDMIDASKDLEIKVTNV